MKTFLNIPVVFAVAALSLSVGCTKKRDAKLADGAGRYMDDVSMYNQKSFSLETLGPKSDVKDQSIQYGQKPDRKTEVKNYGLQDMPMVNFKTAAKVPEGTRLYAIPNQKNRYWVEYQLTNDYLVIHKVAAKADLPLDEQTLAEPSETKPGLLRVPLIGYPIAAKVTREVAKNDLGEKTSRLEDRPVTDIKSAQFVQVDFNKPTEFKKMEKKDVIPADYLKGDWYYGETYIAAPDDLAGYVSDNASGGLDGFNRYYGYQSQSIVRFNVTEKGIEILGAVVPQEALSNDRNLPRLAFIPATPISYRTKTLGNTKAFEEEENKDIPWQKAQFLKVDWYSTNSIYVGTNGKSKDAPQDPDSAKLAFVQLEDNYISLSYDMPYSRRRVQLNFWKKSEHAKVSANYTPKTHSESDWNRFGYFAVNKPVTHDGTRIRQTKDFDNIRYMVRFNPNVKKITYYLSDTTPAEYVDTAVRSVQAWDQAFADAGTGIRIELITDPKERKSVGDIRYNVLNFIGSKSSSGGGSLGVAGVVADPFTGEIISGKANIWHDNVKKSFVHDVDYYIRAKAGTTADRFAPGLQGLQDRFIQSAKAFSASLSKEDAALDKKELISKLFTGRSTKTLRASDMPELSKAFSQALDFRKRTLNNRQLFDAQAEGSIPNIDQDMALYCKDIQSAINQYRETHNDEAKAIAAEKCGLELTKIFLAPFIVHEMGHAFGLRHNFRGSTDQRYWLPKEQNGTPYPSFSSSIMEYGAWDNWKILKPGPYDIAAIRFGYANSIGVDDGTLLGKSVPLKDPTKSITENLQMMGVKDVKYQFCTDEHTDGLDPLCNRWDAGRNANEIVDFYIKQMNESFLLNTYRRDDANIDSNYLSVWRLYSYVLPMMKIYGSWRTYLKDYMKGQAPYLENVSLKDYQKILDKMKTDNTPANSKGDTYASIYAEYRPAVEKLFIFLKNMALLPDRYCVLKKSGSDKMDLIELSKVRDMIYKSTGQSVNSCKAQATLDYFGKNTSVVAEFGYHVNGLRFDKSPESVSLPFDVYPTYLDRIFASQFMAARSYWTGLGAEQEFAPNIMDEPLFREQWMSTLMSRAVEGLSAAALDTVPELKQQLGSQKLQNSQEFFSLFNAEKDILSFSAGMMKNGLWIPGNIPASLERMKVIGGRLTSSSAAGQGATEVTGGMSFSADADAIYSQAVLKKYLQIEILKKADLKKYAPILKVLKDANLPKDEAELAKYTVGNLKDLGPQVKAAVVAVAQASEQEPDQVIQEFAMVFGQDLGLPVVVSIQLSDSITQKIQQLTSADDTDKADADKKLQELLNTPVTKISKDIKPMPVEKIVKQTLQSMNEVRSNAEEASAHQHVLLSILLLNYVETGY